MTLVHPLPPRSSTGSHSASASSASQCAFASSTAFVTERRSVHDLTDSLGTTQQNVSKHLGVLHAEGVVSRRRDGARVLYSIADESVFEICETVCGGIRQHVTELDGLLAGASR